MGGDLASPKPQKNTSSETAFYVRVLYGLSRLNKLQSHSAFFAPGRQCPTAKLRPDLDGRTFPCATVHDGQHPNHPPGGHAITHEIHRPTFIRPRGGWASYRAPPADPPPLPNPHRQTFLAVEPGPHWLTSIHQKPFSFANSAYFKRRCRLCKVARARTPARQPALRLRSGQARRRYVPRGAIMA